MLSDERKCKNCKIPLLPFLYETKRGKRRKFCSLRCNGKYLSKKSRERLLKSRRPCKQCRKLVQRYPSQFRIGRGKFCSRFCANKNKSERGRAWRMCLKCETPFSFQKSRLYNPSARNRYKFCSKKCANESLKKRLKVICSICGTKFELPKCRVCSTNQCSRFCANKAKLTMGEKAAFEQTLYTPQFLRALMEPDEFCRFPGCYELCVKKHFNMKFRLSLCYHHRRNIRSALYIRRRKRNLILRQEGLI